jgi:hypothetical protein
MQDVLCIRIQEMVGDFRFLLYHLLLILPSFQLEEKAIMEVVVMSPAVTVWLNSARCVSEV